MSLFPYPWSGIPALSPLILWALFGVVVIMFAVISWVLHFHWREYGMGKRAVTMGETIYFLGSMGLLASAFVSLLAY